MCFKLELVGNHEERFSHDAVHIMRAVQTIFVLKPMGGRFTFASMFGIKYVSLFDPIWVCNISIKEGTMLIRVNIKIATLLSRCDKRTVQNKTGAFSS